jgi:hypothetical protein
MYQAIGAALRGTPKKILEHRVPPARARLRWSAALPVLVNDRSAQQPTASRACPRSPRRRARGLRTADWSANSHGDEARYEARRPSRTASRRRGGTRVGKCRLHRLPTGGESDFCGESRGSGSDPDEGRAEAVTDAGAGVQRWRVLRQWPGLRRRRDCRRPGSCGATNDNY